MILFIAALLLDVILSKVPKEDVGIIVILLTCLIMWIGWGIKNIWDAAICRHKETRVNTDLIDRLPYKCDTCGTRFRKED